MLNKNINQKKEIFEIQKNKDELIKLESSKINKIIMEFSCLFLLLDNQWIIYDLDININKFIKTIKSNFKIYKIFIEFNYLYFINEKFLIKYDYKIFQKLKEFKWNDDMKIAKIKKYKSFIILRTYVSIIIIDINNFEKLLNLEVEDDSKNNINEEYFNLKNNSIFYISVFDNFLIYRENQNIVVINLDNNFIKEKVFKYNEINQFQLSIYKNYYFISKQNSLNITDLKNNYKSINIKLEHFYPSSMKFKNLNKILFILYMNQLIIYDMNSFKLISIIKYIKYPITNIILIRNTLIIYNNKNLNFTALDYENEHENFDLNISEKKICKYFLKFYNNNLVYIENDNLKINKFKNNLNIFLRINYFLTYKNLYIENDYIFVKIYDIENNYKLLFQKKLNKLFKANIKIHNNYLVIYDQVKLIVLNLDNFNDIKEKKNGFKICQVLIYENILFILFISEYRFIEILNISNFNEIKKIKCSSNLFLIEIYKNYFFTINDKFTTEIYDLKNNIKFIKKIDIDCYFMIVQDFMIYFNKNILVDINNNFKIINIQEEHLGKKIYFFNNILIIYDRSIVYVCKKFKKNYEVLKLKYKNTSNIGSYNNYLFIMENKENTKVIWYENDKFKELKILNTIFNRVYIFDGLLYLIDNYLFKIYNIENNFEEIKEVKCNFLIGCIEYKKDYILIDHNGFYYKMMLKFNNNKISWDKISFNYYLTFEKLKNNNIINLKELYGYFEKNHILDNTILYNYIFKINYNIIKNVENPKLLSDSLEIFGIDKLFNELKDEFDWINNIISNNKINIYLETILSYFINNNHFYEINYSQFLIILQKIKNISLFNIFIKYIFQKTIVPLKYKKNKYMNIDDYKIINSKYLCYNDNLNKKIFNGGNLKNEKKQFKIFNIPFKINEYISENYKLFEILEKSPDFVKSSYLKYLVYYFFDKTKYFKYFNIMIYLLLIISLTVNLVNKNFFLLICYIISILYFIFYEIMQLYFDYKTYVNQLINWFDILLIIYNIVIFIFIYAGRYNSINLIILPLYYLNGYKLIIFLKSIDWIRKEIRLFMNVIKNTYSFIFFILIILIYFTNLNFLFNFNNFKKFNLSFFNVYGQMLGNFDDNFSEYRLYDYLELLINTYSFNIILLNLFISVISKIFDDYNENLELYDIQEKINLLQEFSSVYFIIDYINKKIFKSKKKDKYFFFIFEKNAEEINLIDINTNLIVLEKNIKKNILEVKKEVKEIDSKVENKIEEVKVKVDEITKEVKEIDSKVESKIEEVKGKVDEVTNEIKEIDSKVESKIEEVKGKVDEVKKEINEIKSDIKKILENFIK